MPTIERKQILKAALAGGHVSSVDARTIRFESSGQKTGRHLHPCSVVGYIVEGAAEFQIEGESARTLPAGSAFHEPAGAVISAFNNASNSNPMTFVAFYLLDGEQDLIQMLEEQ